MKILLVDDEDFIRKGMLYTIPWEDHDLEVTEAENGKEALDIALRIHPDIILTDISMPVMDGFELTRKINQLLPDTHVIILTAYDNPDNLKIAIDVQVSAFLVKSANSEQILDTVLKLKAEIDKKQIHNHRINQIKEIFNENQMLIKSTLIHRFFLKQISFSHFSKKCAELDIHLDNVPIALALIECSYDNENYAIGQFLQQFRTYSPMCFFIESHTAVLILDTSQNTFTHETMNQLLPYIQPVVLSNFIAIMTDIQSYEELPLAFQVLRQTLSQCFWNIEVPYTMLTPTAQIMALEKITPYEHEKNVMKAMLSGKAKELTDLFENYYIFMKEHQAMREDFLDSVLRLIVFISSVRNDEINIEELNQLIHEAETPREVLNLLISLFVSDPPETNPVSQLQDALDYMEQHYTEDLYLEDVAKTVYLSPGYFCRIFKKTTGYSFKEYLHYLRIEKAKELIKHTDYKYYEIAEMVGYKNYKYFSSYFNKIVGCSAREYLYKI